MTFLTYGPYTYTGLQSIIHNQAQPPAARLRPSSPATATMQGRLRRLLPAPPPRALLFRSLSSSPPPKGGGDGGSGVPVKQVTRGNLAEVLEELRGRVREATFVGLDLEMSGVTSAPWRDTFELDRDDVRYLKLRDSAERFAALQLGVCPFRWDPAKSAFVAHPCVPLVSPKSPFCSSNPPRFVCFRPTAFWPCFL
jgi:poly(A)-specific ribonuclease